MEGGWQTHEPETEALAVNSSCYFCRMFHLTTPTLLFSPCLNPHFPWSGLGKHGTFPQIQGWRMLTGWVWVTLPGLGHPQVSRSRMCIAPSCTRGWWMSGTVTLRSGLKTTRDPAGRIPVQPGEAPSFPEPPRLPSQRVTCPCNHPIW